MGSKLRRSQIYLTFFVYLRFVDTTIDPPSYQWPLGNTSVLKEVFRGIDMTTEEGKICFAFPEGVPELSHVSDLDLPYKAMRLGGNSVSHVQAQLSPDSQFEDISISMLVYPEDTSGETSTLLQYMKGEDDQKMKEKIRIRVMDTDFIITFRDRFDIPAGLVLIDNPLRLRQWNHLVIVREYRTGQISVFCNGANVYYGEDDEFPNNIPLEEDGMLFIGKAHLEEGDTEYDFPGADEQFTGRISCLQIFQYVVKQEDLNGMLQFCKPERWSYPPSVNLVPDELGGKDIYCLSDVDMKTTTILQSRADVITLRELTNENVWKAVKQRYGWGNSSRNTSYFKLLFRDSTPAAAVSGMGSVNTTNLSVCSRLCMRIDGCKSFSIDEAKDSVRKCELYDSIVDDLITIEGSRYYAIRN